MNPLGPSCCSTSRWGISCSTFATPAENGSRVGGARWGGPVFEAILIQYNTLLDAVVAKTTIVSFISYTLVYKFKPSYLLVLGCIGGSFYMSNKHSALHLLCFVATFYAFRSDP